MNRNEKYYKISKQNSLHLIHSQPTKSPNTPIILDPAFNNIIMWYPKFPILQDRKFST